MVRTSLAAGQLCIKGQLVDIIDAKHSGSIVFGVTFSGDQSGTERTHDTCNIRSGCLAAGNLFKAAQNSIIIESTTLYNDIFSEFARIRKLDNLKQCILDDGVGKSGGNIRNGSAFLLRLFYLGIHKYRTACSEIDRIFRKQGFLREVLYREVKGFCKGLDERAAAGGAGFVQLDAVYGLILDLDAFHILTTDVEDTVNLRIKECSGIVVGNGFNLSLIQH